jgi:hypothetical protein
VRQVVALYRPVKVGESGGVVERRSSLYRLLEGGQGRLEFAPVAHLLRDRQAARGSVAPAGTGCIPIAYRPSDPASWTLSSRPGTRTSRTHALSRPGRTSCPLGCHPAFCGVLPDNEKPRLSGAFLLAAGQGFEP